MAVRGAVMERETEWSERERPGGEA